MMMELVKDPPKDYAAVGHTTTTAPKKKFCFHLISDLQPYTLMSGFTSSLLLTPVRLREEIMNNG